MERRLVIAAALAASLAAAPHAHAQLRPAATRLPAAGSTRQGAGAIGGLAAVDLLFLSPGGNSSAAYYPDGDLRTRGRLSPYAIPGVPTFDAALGSFDGGSVPDVVWEVNTTVVSIGAGFTIAWGSAPGATETFRDVYTYVSHGIAPLRLLPRAAPLLVVAHGQTQSQNTVTVLDLLGAKGTGAPAGRVQLNTGPTGAPSTYFFSSVDDDPDRDRAHALRASPAALTVGVSDGAIPLMRGFRLLWNRTAAGATTVAGLALDYVDVGDPNILNELSYLNGTTSLLEPGLALQTGSSCFGVAGLEVDGDGAPDLVFTMRESPGKLLWLHATATAAGLSTSIWHDLTARADLQPLQDPRVLRQVELAGGATAVALHDVALDQILLISGDGVTGFTVHRLPAFGGLVRDLWTADVAGTSAPDLVAWVTAPGGQPEVWVYPDDLDPTTWLGWSPTAPATARLGVDLPLSVAATEPGSIVTLLSTTPAAVALQGSTFTVPGSALCSAAPVDVLARAAILRPGDDLGVLQQIGAAVSLEAVPTLVVAGAGAPDGLVLTPGGASGRSEGAAWPACQTTTRPAYTWGEVALPGVTTVAEQPAGSASAWRDFTVPESAYPILLSGAQPPALTLTATGPTTAATGDVSGTASLALALDARSLVAASVAFGSPVLGPGELGTARVTLASRIGVPLPRVRAEVRLAGLVLAGALEVDGALATAQTANTVTLDALPASPATVELVVPVRSLGLPGGLSVELFSEGGHRLSPEAPPAADAPRLPGCGCGQGGGAEGLPIALLLLFLVPSLLPHRGRGPLPMKTSPLPHRGRATTDENLPSPPPGERAG